MRAEVEPFLDPDTETFSYVVYERAGGCVAVIDPVLDYDPKAGRTGTAGAERLVDFVRDRQLTVDWILETHAHADHLSAAPFVREQVGGLPCDRRKDSRCVRDLPGYLQSRSGVRAGRQPVRQAVRGRGDFLDR